MRSDEVSHCVGGGRRGEVRHDSVFGFWGLYLNPRVEACLVGQWCVAL